VILYQALELRDELGKPLGRWRQTMSCDEAPRLEHPVPLCSCPNGHESRQAARQCPVVQAALPPELRDRPDDEASE
jgi:hypothetical protein